MSEEGEGVKLGSMPLSASHRAKGQAGPLANAPPFRHSEAMTNATQRIDIHWMRTDDIDEELHQRLLTLLSESERQAHQRLAKAEDRILYAAAHALARHALTRRFGTHSALWSFVDGTHGKPRVSNPPDGTAPRFNLSHTPGLVAVAVSDGIELGLDVEALDPTHADLDTAKAFAHPAELRELAPSAPDFIAAFYRLWTRKEALAKATGLGLSLEVRHLIFEDEIRDQWQLAEWDVTPQHRMAVVTAWNGITSEVTVRSITCQELLDSF